MAAAPALKFLSPAWFSIVMGLSGLALAWRRAVPLMGEPALALSIALGGLAAAVFLVLAGLSVLRLQRHPEAWAEDLRHPVRHAFVATVPVSLILLGTLGVALDGPGALAEAVWWAGSLGQLAVTVWVLSRWWAGNRAGGLQWATVTPVLIIAVVGNVLVPLAGVELGHAEWAAAQFGIGLLFWPLVMALLLVRIASQGLWPERLMPSLFILIAPPAVIGLSALALGAPARVGWMAWGVALACFLWVATQGQRIVSQAFSVGHWAVSFPLAAFAGLTLELGRHGSGGPMPVFGPLLLAFASVIVLGLSMGTVRGLRQRTLLAPEPVATITPISG
ncbi:MAG: SLAC1 anion channel family protein [Sphaerotilus sulfidivorans]|jgi:tellurite resistance protein|uniref:SLAC1 anion channel family protein n=1 Tax=Sphaerotilus sulfidivorans TaxID=639200 RepID=UPI0032301182